MLGNTSVNNPSVLHGGVLAQLFDLRRGFLVRDESIMSSRLIQHIFIPAKYTLAKTIAISSHQYHLGAISAIDFLPTKFPIPHG